MSGDPFGSTLVYEGEMTLRWREVDALPDEATLVRLGRSNEELLHVLAALEGSRTESAVEEEGLGAELARLDFKLNLVLSVLGELLAQRLELPAPCPARFNSEALAWRGDELPAPGTLLELSLYAHAALPRPLRLFGRVASVAAGEAVVRFEGIGGELSDLIYKFVFRHHRRGVAQARAARAGDK